MPKYGLRGPGGTAAGLCVPNVSLCAKSPVLLGVCVCLPGTHLALVFLEPGMFPWLLRRNTEPVAFTLVSAGEPYALLLLF